MGSLLENFDKKKYEKTIREESYELGREEGYELGHRKAVRKAIVLDISTGKYAFILHK